MTERSARLTRGFLAAAFATYTAAFSHEAAGGGHPALSVIALALVLSVAVSVWLAGRRFSRIRVAVSIGLSQLAFHSLFAFFGPATDAVAATPGAFHNHALMLAPALGAQTAATVTVDAAMIVFHSAAALATVLVVFYGERAARLALNRGRTAIAPLLHATQLTAALPTRPLRASGAAWASTPRPRKLEPLIGSLRHRGPPTSLAHA